MEGWKIMAGWKNGRVEGWKGEHAVCKVFVPKVCHYRKWIAKPLLQRSNMSIEKGLSTAALLMKIK